jgi:hypothetical protein
LAGAVITGKAYILTFEAADAAAAFCFFSAEGKEKRNFIKPVPIIVSITFDRPGAVSKIPIIIANLL